MSIEIITHKSGNDEAWICICGNTPVSDGFFTCDKEGNEMEATKEGQLEAAPTQIPSPLT